MHQREKTQLEQRHRNGWRHFPEYRYSTHLLGNGEIYWGGRRWLYTLEEVGVSYIIHIYVYVEYVRECISTVVISRHDLSPS